MLHFIHPAAGRLRHRLRGALSGTHLLAFVPAVSLGAFWLGGEGALAVVAIMLPALLALAGSGPDPAGLAVDPRVPVTRAALEDRVEAALHRAAMTSGATMCLMVELDDAEALGTHHGPAAMDRILAQMGERMRSALRPADLLHRVAPARYMAVLEPARRLDLDTALSLAARLQRAVEEPVSLDGATIYLSCSAGICLSSRSPDDTAPGLIGAAETALAEARRHGPSSVRAWSGDLQRLQVTRNMLSDEAAEALENGQIRAWFQPQISTETGRVSGFEALARWIHPDHGLIAPDEFLPVLEAAGLIERLGEVMLLQALTALQAWDRAGLDVPQVGVNFAGAELRNPKLKDKIAWELDRFDLPAGRLAVEVLETVVAAAPDDTTTHNINALAALGCRIDLDDFGTGQASLSSLRRFRVSRLKIDRSFVMKADRDPQQQRMVTAILSMADRLGLETLAEGVETRGEHALLAQLGCGHVQGFGIARPMPFEQTVDWMTLHDARLQDMPRIGRQAG